MWALNPVAVFVVADFMRNLGRRAGSGYRLEALLGAGGMGQVYRATDTRLSRQVAIKVSQQRFTDRFEREARAIAALNHPNVCTLYDVGPNYLVMELVEGETLSARLKRGKLSIEQATGYGSQIAGALVAAHATGIHRDLKPGNIMLTKSGVKVLDFGLAKSAQDETLTVANAVMGTPAYMAPEQREGKKCDARADIYALGLVIYEMATGMRLPAGDQARFDALQEKLSHAIERCLAQDPDGRWQSAHDLKAELEWAALGWAAKDERGAKAASTGRGLRPWLIVAGVAAMAAIIATASWARLYFQMPEMRAIYSTILPPEKTTFDFATNLGVVALSPDGTRMVFAATGEDGQRQLWLRALDAPRTQPLTATQNATFPFWSPDSRWVAFFADGILKKVDTRGGTPVPLTVVPGGGLGGSWSAKGQIVFATSTFTPMLKVSSDGGDTSLAIETPGQGFPWFLPDGEHFLFSAWVGEGRATLRVGSLGSTASDLIGEADSNAVYSQGRLLFLRGNSLMAQPFDLKSLRTSGEAMPVAEHVQRFLALLGVGAFSASSTGLLAYQTGADAAVQQLTWFDRTGKPLGTLGEPRAFWDVEFSPDRKTLIASAPDGVGNYDLWTYDVARDLPTRFTSNPGGEYFGVWSADGRSVIFNSARGGQTDLYRKAANGSGPEERIYADSTGKVPISWSHDGKYLLYFTGGVERHQLFLLPLMPDRPGAPLKSVRFLSTQSNETYAKFSPDDQWVAYQTDQSGRSEVYVAPFSRPEEKHQISTDGGKFPRWRRDGRAIFYQGADGQLRQAEIRIGGNTVEVTAVRPVFGKGGFLGGYGDDVSLDEQRVLAANPVGGTAEPITLVENWVAAPK